MGCEVVASGDDNGVGGGWGGGIGEDVGGRDSGLVMLV